MTADETLFATDSTNGKARSTHAYAETSQYIAKTQVCHLIKILHGKYNRYPLS
jgi:hypothetical protein